MSKHETPLTLWYWEQVGGTLIEEFCAVQRTKTCERRTIDGVIIKGGPKKRVRQSEVDLKDKDVIVIQTKAERLGMNLMGQTFFSGLLMRKFGPRSVEAVALVLQDDTELRPLLEQQRGMRVVVYSPSVNDLGGAPTA